MATLLLYVRHIIIVMVLWLLSLLLICLLFLFPLSHLITPTCIQRWRELCEVSRTLQWSKVDTKDGVTIARCKFGRSSHGHAIVKLEGTLAADPATVYQFLQISTREGGKVCTSSLKLSLASVYLVVYWLVCFTAGLHFQEWNCSSGIWWYITHSK